MAFKLAKLSKRFTFIPPLTPHRFTGSEVRVCDDTIPLTGIAQTVDDCDWTNNGNVPLMVANTLNRTWDRSHSKFPVIICLKTLHFYVSTEQAQHQLPKTSAGNNCAITEVYSIELIVSASHQCRRHSSI